MKKKEHDKIKLGFVPTRRENSIDQHIGDLKKRILDVVRSFDCGIVDMDMVNSEGIIYSAKDADKVGKILRCEEVDAVFFPHCNFGCEEAVAEIANIVKKPLLIWAPREEIYAPDGGRLRDSQCGIFTTSKALGRYGIPFTYISTCSLKDKVFQRGLGGFLSVASIVKTFSKLRIGQISLRPNPYLSVIYNEGELLERFGIKIVPTTHLDIVQGIESVVKENGVALRDTIDDIRCRISDIRINTEELRKIAALKVFLREWAETENLSALAIQCWAALHKTTGIMSCFANSELTQEGIPVACETDVHGAITSILLQAAAMHKKPTFFADITIRHPIENNTELLWHCGNFPHVLCNNKNESAISDHYKNKKPGVNDWAIQGGDITISRFDGNRGEYSLLLGHGKGVEGPRTKGTYLWAEFKDWPKWERKLVYGPYMHHCSGIHGSFAPELCEACRYIPGLRPDPVEPDIEELERFWME